MKKLRQGKIKIALNYNISRYCLKVQKYCTSIIWIIICCWETVFGYGRSTSLNKLYSIRLSHSKVVYHFSGTNRLWFPSLHNFRPRPRYVFSVLELNRPRSYIENRRRFTTLPNRAPLTNQWRFVYFGNQGRFKIEHGFRTFKIEDECN